MKFEVVGAKANRSAEKNGLQSSLHFCMCPLKIKILCAVVIFCRILYIQGPLKVSHTVIFAIHFYGDPKRSVVDLDLDGNLCTSNCSSAKISCEILIQNFTKTSH
jgi:hypothetical protein